MEIFQQNMSLNQRNLRGVPIDLKLNNLDLSGNTTEFKTLPTRPRSHRYILFYIFAVESVKICRFKTFWMSIFAFSICSMKAFSFKTVVNPKQVRFMHSENISKLKFTNQN